MFVQQRHAPIAAATYVVSVGNATTHHAFTTLQHVEEGSMSGDSLPEFLTVEDVGRILSRSRASVYNYVKVLHIPTHKFLGNRHRYIRRGDVERLQEYLRHPWTINS